MKQEARYLDLKRGKLIVFSSGAYSDYSYLGNAFVVLQDVSEEQLREVEKETKEADNEYYPAETFIALCIKKGWLLEVELKEIHLGETYDTGFGLSSWDYT